MRPDTNRGRRGTFILVLTVGHMSLLLPRVALSATSTAILMSGTSCPDRAVLAHVEQGLRALRLSLSNLPHEAVTAALARVRARRGLERARELYTRTVFQGCAALLAISERELAIDRGAPDPLSERRGLELLARVNLWLGICRWGGGELARASDHFVLANRLPGRPRPDPTLLPPEIVEAYGKAVAAPPSEVACVVDPSLEHVVIDGQPVREGSGQVTLPAGTHYVTASTSCKGGSTACGPVHHRSFSLVVAPPTCRIYLPASQAMASPVACASPHEARDPAFVSELTYDLRSDSTLAVSVDGDQIGLRLYRQGDHAFSHQVVTELSSDKDRGTELLRVLGLVFGVRQEQQTPRPFKWYRSWWVWTLASAVVAGSVTAVVLATRPANVTEYRIHIGP